MWFIHLLLGLIKFHAVHKKYGDGKILINHPGVVPAVNK